MKRSRRKSRKKRSSRASSRLSRVLSVAALLVVVSVIAAGGTLLWLWPRCSGDGCPSVEALRDYTPPQATQVMDRTGEVIAHLAPQRRTVVPLGQIPSHVSGAFLAVEDKRFFQHEGIDYRRVAGAIVADVRALSFAEGFSTLTMQLARNVFPEHLTRSKTLRRKLWEVMLARKIEEAFTKEEILQMYLNQIYLGDGLYGVEAAARGYFGKPVGELAIQEAALLAALPKAPSYYNPRENPDAALERRNLVLRLMANAGVIEPEAAEAAQEKPLGLVPPIESKGSAPYFVAAVRSELREKFGPGAATAGLRVYTTVDSEMQQAARRALEEQLAAVEADEWGNFRGPVCSTGEVENPEACLQGLFVAVDVQRGDVLALVGGRDFALSQFNRVMQARRQAGSAFKPIVYATALEAGIPISTPLVGPGAEPYTGDYWPADHIPDSATINLREGLQLSSNRAAVVLGQRAGLGNVVKQARELGLSTPIQEYPSTVLGAADVIPLELVAAYTAFANNGVRVVPRLIRRVENAAGEVLWEVPVRKEAVLSPEAAFLTTSLMQDVVNRGTGIRVRTTGGLPWAVPAAGKTGTTDDAADTWFVGVTPDVAAGVWVGFDQRKQILAGAEGGRLAAPVWGRVMAEYYETHPVPPSWMAPFGLVQARIDHESGYLATEGCPEELVVEEWFIPGTAPEGHCPLHPEPGIDGWFRRTIRGIGDMITGDGEEAAAEQGAR